MSFIKKFKTRRSGPGATEKSDKDSEIREIGLPMEVKHNLHINIDMVTGDLILSETWKKLLHSADIS
jgi:hypothetical protein